METVKHVQSIEGKNTGKSKEVKRRNVQVGIYNPTRKHWNVGKILKSILLNTERQ